MNNNYILYGSGGHAKVVVESLASESKVVVGLFDDNPEKSEFKNIPILGLYDPTILFDFQVIISIGNNKIRKAISKKVNHNFGITCYTSNIISPSLTIKKGSVVLQGAIIQADVMIGEHVIINTGAIVEHDCVISDYVHLAPGSVICGNVQVGEGTLIGANSVIAPGIKVGKWCQISAGSSVLEDIPDYSLVMGVPGKIIKIIDHEASFKS